MCSTLTAPYLENFSATNTPTCWTESGSEAWNYNLNAGLYCCDSRRPYTGWWYELCLDDGSLPTGSQSSIYLISPTIDITALGLPGLRFYVYSKNDDDGSYNEWSAVLTDGNGVNVTIYQSPAADDPSSDFGGWREFTYDLTSTTGPVFVIFTVTESGSAPFYNDILIDDFEVFEQATCDQVTSVNTDTISYTTADISWTPGGPEPQWTVIYGQSGFDPSTTGTTITSAMPSYTISGLDGNTTYDYYVKRM